MSSHLDELKKLELISTARQLLQTEYIQKRTDEYTTWKANNQNAWQSGNAIVPFPPFVINSAFVPFQPTTPYPSEQDVVAKALELYNDFVAQQLASAPTVDPAAPVESEVVPEPVVETMNEPVVEESVSSDSVVTVDPVSVEPDVEPVVDTVIEPVIEPVVEPVIEPVPVVEPVVEPQTKTTGSYADEIYKIYEIVDTSEPTTFVKEPAPSVYSDLDAVPQPSEELAKINTTGRILPSVLKRLQGMKSSWTSDKGTTE